RYEADVDHDDFGPRRQAGVFQLADVGGFHRHDLGMAVQRTVQLAVADVDGKHHRGAVREQHLGEATGGGADVEADVILDLDRVLLQCAGELDAASRHPG